MKASVMGTRRFIEGEGRGLRRRGFGCVGDAPVVGLASPGNALGTLSSRRKKRFANHATMRANVLINTTVRAVRAPMRPSARSQRAVAVQVAAVRNCGPMTWLPRAEFRSHHWSAIGNLSKISPPRTATRAEPRGAEVQTQPARQRHRRRRHAHSRRASRSRPEERGRGLGRAHAGNTPHPHRTRQGQRDRNAHDTLNRQKDRDLHRRRGRRSLPPRRRQRRRDEALTHGPPRALRCVNAFTTLVNAFTHGVIGAG